MGKSQIFIQSYVMIGNIIQQPHLGDIMKKLLSISIFCVISLQSAMASFNHYNCEAYRVSAKNEAIETLKISNHSASLNGVDLKIKEDGYGLTTEKVLKSDDGKGDYAVNIAVNSVTTSLSGKDGARDHNIDIDKVLIKLSRNSKSHVFEGICIEESESSCGGKCDTSDDDNELDEL